MAFKLQTPDRAREVQMVLDELNKDGMTGIDVSDDEMAKSHGRYMIGGPQNVANERLFRFGQSPDGCWLWVKALMYRRRISRETRRAAKVLA